jgi:hypothetical protein
MQTFENQLNTNNRLCVVAKWTAKWTNKWTAFPAFPPATRK